MGGETGMVLLVIITLLMHLSHNQFSYLSIGYCMVIFISTKVEHSQHTSYFHTILFPITTTLAIAILCSCVYMHALYHTHMVQNMHIEISK